jgi:CRP-like cAMP-binding protein
MRPTHAASPSFAGTLERLAASLVPERTSVGATLVREGDPGDRYFIVARGTVEVLVGGEPVRELSAGEGFGEIALLRSVPRTATVRAVVDVELLTLRRDIFLEAVTGHPQSSAAADAVIQHHLSPCRPVTVARRP